MKAGPMKARLLRGALWLLLAIPFRLRVVLFQGLMMLICAVDGKHRRIGRINVGFAFPELGDAEAARLIRRCYRNLGATAAEFIELPRLDRAWVDRNVKFEGLDRVVAAIAGGRGAIAVTAHFGNWELLGHVFGIVTGGRGAFIVRPLKDADLDDIVEERREVTGNRVIRNEDSAHAVVREIREGRLIGILADQNRDRRKGIFVDFFSKQACSPDGAARIALSLKVPIFPTYICRDQESKFMHVVRFGEPFAMNFDAPRDAEVARLTRLANASLEDAIRRSPSEWLWFQRRWGTAPVGEPERYPK